MPDCEGFFFEGTIRPEILSKARRPGGNYMAAPRRRLRAHAIIIAFIVGIGAAACSRSSAAPTATPAPSDTPAPSATLAVQQTPTATPAPADAALGDKLRYEGDFDGAIGVYASIASGGDAVARQRARLGQAQLLVRANRPGDARPVLDAYLAAGGPGADSSEARYMLASALDDLGDTQGSLDNYERYIAANGVLADFARIERAKLLARLGRVPDALAAAAAVRASMTLLPAFRSSFTFSFAAALQQGGADAAAIEWYDRARIEGGDAASALARTGAIKKRLGNPAWSADELQAIAAYPDAAVASDLLDELDGAAVPVGDFVRGVVDYRAGRDDAARTALTNAIAVADHAAEATYYLAAIDERAGSKATAIEGYQRAHDLDPTSPRADDALWWGGRLLESAGRYDEAVTAYGALTDAYPASKWRTDAAFRRGLALYRARNYAGAALAWASMVPASSGEDAARARFWQGRALLAQHDILAAPVLGALIDETAMGTQGSYYGLRAEVLLGRNDTQQGVANLNGGAIDWQKIASYVQAGTGIDPQAAAPAVSSDVRWIVAAALEDVGLHAQSDAVFRSLLDGGAADLYYIARRLDNEGRTGLASRAATMLIAKLAPPAQQPPDDLLRVAYPPAYGDLASAAANDEHVSPLLLLALVRQESFYDAQAGSSAGALGLTQVMPSTGAAIAGGLGVTAFTASDLYRPKLNLRFGASYLSDQLQQFDGDAYHALAAYNGGPGAARSALATAGGDEDLFVEELEFDETQQYVRRVMENYARYRQVYEGIGRPSLAR
jgi:soluble lytic murein transglycosylase